MLSDATIPSGTGVEGGWDDLKSLHPTSHPPSQLNPQSDYRAWRVPQLLSPAGWLVGCGLADGAAWFSITIAFDFLFLAQLSMAPLICTSLLCSFEVSLPGPPPGGRGAPTGNGRLVVESVVIVQGWWTLTRNDFPPFGMYVSVIVLPTQWWRQQDDLKILLLASSWWVWNAIEATERKFTHLARFVQGGCENKIEWRKFIGKGVSAYSFHELIIHMFSISFVLMNA